jgi:hypothetical protein
LLAFRYVTGCRKPLLSRGEHPSHPSVWTMLPGITEPHRQGSSRVLENGPRRHRSLRAARRAFQQHAADRPCLAATALRTAKALGPTQLCQILSARCFGREARLQFNQVARIIFREPKRYSLWLPESSRYRSHTNEGSGSRLTYPVLNSSPRPKWRELTSDRVANGAAAFDFLQSLLPTVWDRV